MGPFSTFPHFLLHFPEHTQSWSVRVGSPGSTGLVGMGGQGGGGHCAQPHSQASFGYGRLARHLEYLSSGPPCPLRMKEETMNASISNGFLSASSTFAGQWCSVSQRSNLKIQQWKVSSPRTTLLKTGKPLEINTSFADKISRNILPSYVGCQS